MRVEVCTRYADLKAVYSVFHQSFDEVMRNFVHEIVFAQLPNAVAAAEYKDCRVWRAAAEDELGIERTVAGTAQ